MTTVTLAKGGYLKLARGYGSVSRATGLAPWLDARRGRSRLAHWLRSLSAIHDLDELVRLDVPWWTYGAIEKVEAFLAERPGARVFEFGSGASTVWLAKRAGSVRSVEHHAGWFERVEGFLAETNGLAPVELMLVEPDAANADDPIYVSQKRGEAGHVFRSYASSIERTRELYDLIVVDGRARAACLRHALDRLAPGGLVVFDNTGRRRYRDAIAASAVEAERIRGLAPALPYPDETTLLRQTR